MGENPNTRMARPPYLSPGATFEHIENLHQAYACRNAYLARRLASGRSYQRSSLHTSRSLGARGGANKWAKNSYNRNSKYSGCESGEKSDSGCEQSTDDESADFGDDESEEDNEAKYEYETSKPAREEATTDSNMRGATYIGYYYRDPVRKPTHLETPFEHRREELSPPNSSANAHRSLPSRRLMFDKREEGFSEPTIPNWHQRNDDSGNIGGTKIENEGVSEYWNTDGDRHDNDIDEDERSTSSGRSSRSSSPFTPLSTRCFSLLHADATYPPEEASSASSSEGILTPASTPAPSEHWSDLSSEESEDEESALYSNGEEDLHDVTSEDTTDNEVETVEDSDSPDKNWDQLKDTLKNLLRSPSRSDNSSTSNPDTAHTLDLGLAPDEIVRLVQNGWIMTDEYDDDGTHFVYMWEPESWWSKLLGLLLAVGFVVALILDEASRL